MTEIEYQTSDRLTKERIGEIFRIGKEKGLTAENLLAEASKKNSLLHELFEWDDSKSANLYRLQQARVLINEVKVMVAGHLYPGIENVKVLIEGINGTKTLERIYLPRVEILDKPELKIQLLRRALNNINYWKEQYKSYREFKPIVFAIEKTTKSLERKWIKVEKKKQ